MKAHLPTFDQKIRECHTSEEEESRSSGGATAAAPKRPKVGEGCGTEAASIEVVRRPRGRPLGSKNKPKPPVIVTSDAGEAPLQPHILEVTAGADVADALDRFARRRSVGLCVLSAAGSVSNATLRQPSAPAAISFSGRFDILSISATILPPRPPSPPALAGDPEGLSVSLAGPRGQIIGGFVAGPLIAAETVVLLAAAFTNPTYHRLPLEDDASAAGASPSVTDAATPASAVDSGSGHSLAQDHGHRSVAESIYSPHFVPPHHHHIIWAPAHGRQPHPPPLPPPHPYS